MTGRVKNRCFFRLIDISTENSLEYSSTGRWIIVNLRLRNRKSSFPATKLLLLHETKKKRERKGPRNPFDPNIWFDVCACEDASFLSFFLSFFSIQEESKNFPNEERKRRLRRRCIFFSLRPVLPLSLSFSPSRESRSRSLSIARDRFCDRQWPSRPRTSRERKRENPSTHRVN